MQYRTRVVCLLAIGGPMLLAVGCGGEDATGPETETGSIQVTTTTSGSDLDADGYTVTLDGGSDRAIARDGSTTFSSVATGQHQVALTGVADNCSVAGANPIAATVTSGRTTQVTLEVVCEAPTGFIQVSTGTSGEDLDPDGYTATLDGGSDRSIGLNGVTTFSDAAVGQHQVELTGIADNCSVTGANPAGASVTAGATVAVSFTVECEALPIGSLEVTTTVTNNFDPDGYQVAVASVVRGPVDVDGSALFDELPAGMQQVELRDIAPNCAVDGDNPATVDIPVGGVGTHTFSVVCTNPPDGRIVFRGSDGIRVMNADGSGQLLVWACPNICNRPRWAPNGSTILFESDYSDGFRNLYLMNQDGTGLTQVTEYTGSYEPLFSEWSPSGQRILFSRNDTRTGQSALWSINPDGTGLQGIPRDAPLYRETQPDWSPDGTKIVFWGHNQGFEDSGIYVMNADGTDVVQILPPPPDCVASGGISWFDWHPQWSPDGSRIAFARDHMCEPESTSNGSDLLLVTPDGTDVVNLTDSPEYESWPRWSPDGSKIVYGDGSTLLVMDADGTNQQSIGGAGTADWGP